MIINLANGEVLPAAHAVLTQTQKKLLERGAMIINPENGDRRTLSRHKHNDKRLERGAMIINLANGEVLPTAHAVQTQTQR